MSNEKNGKREKVVSVVDVQQRIADGAHSIWVAIICLALAILAFLVHYFFGWYSQDVLVAMWVILIVIGAVVLNVAFFVRLKLVNSAEDRRGKVGRSLTPDTNASEKVCDMTYEEAVQRLEQPRRPHTGNH